MPSDAPTIYVLMGRVLAELPAIGKDDYNQQQKFHFRGIDAVLNALNPLLARHGVFYVPEVVERLEAQRQTKGGTVMYVVNLHVRYRFYGPAGDYVEASAWGEGTDMGDKATNKAMTGAMKYMLFQVFAISTAEASDADAGPTEETVPAYDCSEGCGFRGSRDAMRDHLHVVHHWPMTDDGRVTRPKSPAPSPQRSSLSSDEGVPPPLGAGPSPAAPPTASDDGGGEAAQGAPEAAPPPSAPSAPSRAKLHALIAEKGIADRHRWAGDVLGRTVESYRDLTQADTNALIKAAEAAPAAPTLEGVG